MKQPFTAVMLAGGIRPSPLSRNLGLPTLALPVTPDRSLLRSWIEALSKTGSCQSVIIVVSTQEQETALSRHMSEWNEQRTILETRVAIEPTRWRGTAGVLRDAFLPISGDIVMLLEGVCLPPPRLRRLLAALDETTEAAVGIGAHDRPAGAYLFRRGAIETIPEVGFVDVKEQFLPALYRAGRPAKAVTVAGHVVRLRDRASYLEAVAFGVVGPPHSVHTPSAAWPGRIAGSARVSGSLIGRNVTVSERALVADSVLLDNAYIGEGAVINRCIVGPNAEVEEGRFMSNAVQVTRRR